MTPTKDAGSGVIPRKITSNQKTKQDNEIFKICAKKEHSIHFRSGRLQVFFKIVILKNFAILKGKHLCWSVILTLHFFNFIKKRLQHVCFPVNIAKFLRTAIYTENGGCFCHFK